MYEQSGLSGLEKLITRCENSIQFSYQQLNASLHIVLNIETLILNLAIM